MKEQRKVALFLSADVAADLDLLSRWLAFTTGGRISASRTIERLLQDSPLLPQARAALGAKVKTRT